MRLLIIYASTEGQTRKIARFLFDHLSDVGYTVALTSAAEATAPNAARFDGVIVAGSVHAGHYQRDLQDLVEAEMAAFAALPTLFLSVSLSAAGRDAADWQGLEEAVQRFQAATGWTPGQVIHVAGAFRFSEYDFFKYWAMRWIASQKGETVTPGEDREYTNWAQLRADVDQWIAGLAG